MKYDVRFCKCGHIHLIPQERIDACLKEDKDFLLICGSCGTTTVIGADIEPDFDDPAKTCYNMYSRDKSEETCVLADKDGIKQSAYKLYGEIYYDKGISVPMMSGMNATSFFNSRFYDNWYPDFYRIQRPGVTIKEIMDFIKKYHRDRTTVNMQRFINEHTNEELEAISAYLIDGFDWTGTLYERK